MSREESPPRTGSPEQDVSGSLPYTGRMMDANKAIDAFAWPSVFLLAIVVFLLLFRRPIADLIGRARRMGFGNKSIDLGDAALPTAEQQKTLDAPKTIEPKLSAQRPPPPNVPVADIESEIEAAIKSGGLSPELQRAWLIRTVALLRLARGHEVSYRVIVGSQLTLLVQANSATPPTMSQARQAYEAAKAAYPDAYRTFTFESWIHWPVNAGLLRIDTGGPEQLLRITPVGQDFLHYLVDNSLTSPKPG
jgi:hypothetical protein